MSSQVFWLLLPLSAALAIHLGHRSHLWYLDQRDHPRPKRFIDIDLEAQAHRHARQNVA